MDPRTTTPHRDDAARAPSPSYFASANCRCAVGCSPLSAARCLYALSLDAMVAGMSGEALRRELLPPLARLVALHRRAEGHLLCHEFAQALETEDDAGVLNTAQRLIKLSLPGAGSSGDRV
jgi:hypothetical protein